jgi:hypothetical protein
MNPARRKPGGVLLFNSRSISTLNGCDDAHYAIAFLANGDPGFTDPKNLRHPLTIFGKILEFFYVMSGRLLIDLEGRTIDILPGQAFVVPRGVVHRTRAPERTIILMVENAGIIPTGDT